MLESYFLLEMEKEEIIFLKIVENLIHVHYYTQVS